MSWQPVNLATPMADASALSQNLSVFTVSPWTSGVKEGSGNNTWLSFPNAVAAVIDRVDSAKAVFALAISAASLTDLAKQAGALAQVLPIKQINQWQRQAKTLAALEIDKFTLVEATVSNQSLAITALTTVNARTKKAISQSALTEAAGLSGDDPLANLSSFETAKSAHDAAVNAALPDLAGGAGYRLYAETDIKQALVENQLDHRYTLTAMMVFQGEPADLAYLVEMMP